MLLTMTLMWYNSNMTECNRCHLRKDIMEFYDSNKYTCKLCVSEAHKKWLLLPGNLEKKRAYSRKSAGIARRKDPERIFDNKKRSEFRLKKEVFSHYSANVQCFCCGEGNLLFLTMDHVDNNGAEHRQKIIGEDYNRTKRGDLSGRQFYAWLKKNDYPDEPRLQVLCYNCNCGKVANKGVCPHKGVQWKN